MQLCEPLFYVQHLTMHVMTYSVWSLFFFPLQLPFCCFSTATAWNCTSAPCPLGGSVWRGDRSNVLCVKWSRHFGYLITSAWGH